MLGSQNSEAEDGYLNGYIGVSYGIYTDLNTYTSETITQFKQEAVDILLEKDEAKSKIALGYACNTVWRIGHEMNEGDIVITPNGNDGYYIGTVSGDYQYHPDHTLIHQRPVTWITGSLSKQNMSDELVRSLSTMRTFSSLDLYADEIELLMSQPEILNEETSSPSSFALESHLEDYLVKHWNQTLLGREYDIFTDDSGELIGQQYPSDTGPLDILAISKDKKELLVVELKRGRTSDRVVGQIQRYMGYVKSELAEPNQKVRGIIIASQYDTRIERALSVTQDIELYIYNLEMSLKPYLG